MTHKYLDRLKSLTIYLPSARLPLMKHALEKMASPLEMGHGTACTMYYIYILYLKHGSTMVLHLLYFISNKI